MTWAQDQRIGFIKQQIEAGENVTRSDVASRFNCTVQTVTATFHEFKRRHPDLMAYDPKVKAYRRADLAGSADLSWKERAQAAESRAEALTRENEGLREAVKALRPFSSAYDQIVADHGLDWFPDEGVAVRSALAYPVANASVVWRHFRLASEATKAALPPTADEPAKGEG